MNHTCQHDHTLLTEFYRVPDCDLTPQQRFDRMYVTSTEITQRCHVSRAAVTHALKRGMLPEPVIAVQQYFWEREVIEPYIAAWNNVLAARRGTAAVKDAVAVANASRSSFAPLYAKPVTMSEFQKMRPAQLPDPEDNE